MTGSAGSPRRSRSWRACSIHHDPQRQDPQTFGDLLYAVVTGQRNAEDSERKAKATRAGLRRRAERGEAVGAIPLGYRYDPAIVDGRAVTRRVVDSEGAALYERIVGLIERG